MKRASTGEDLAAEVARLQLENALLQAEYDNLVQRFTELEEQLRLERAYRFAPKSEKSRNRVFNEAEQAAAQEGADEEGDDEETAAVPDTGRGEGEKSKGKKRGRKPLPAGLPRQRVEYDLPEDQKVCPCCAQALHRMGEIITEQLHIEVKATVLENARFKYACRNCERTGISTPIVTASMPIQPLPGSVATPATLALVLANKYVDGQPLYRLAEGLERANVSISRGTLGHWVIRSSEMHLERIFDALKGRLTTQDLIHGDETWVQVLKEDGRNPTSKSYMWGYRSAEDSAEPIVLFDYQPGRGQQYPQAFLSGYTGTIMSDGYDVWRTLDGVTNLGCMAHARRKFTDAIKGMKTPRGAAVEALKFFEALYEVERLARQALPAGETQSDYTLRMRQQHSVPVLDALKEWLDARVDKFPPESGTGKAINYTLNQWEYLIRYARQGSAPIDNNILERDIRKFVTGRKNWLFSDTVGGAKASSVIYSLALTCRACGVDPYNWFVHVLTELPQRGPDNDIEDLLPFNFKRKRAAVDDTG